MHMLDTTASRPVDRNQFHLSKPLVSVVIPAYNAVTTLREAIDSVLTQTYQPLELIVVDDGSNDGTTDLLRTYGDRVKAVHQPNGGLAAARNAGVALATGELIALFDADDICEPHRIETQVEFMSADAELMLCASDFAAFDANGPISKSHIAAYYAAVGHVDGGLKALFGGTGDPLFSGWVHDQLVWGNFLHPPTVMFRRSLLSSVGNFSRSLRNLCDYDWLLRVARQAKIGVIPQSLIRYRLSPGQMSGDRNSLQVKLDLIDILEGIAAADPSFRQRSGTRFAERLARAHYGAAEHLAPVDRKLAWGHLRTAASLHRPDRAQLPLLAKLLLPNALWGIARQLRRQAGCVAAIELAPIWTGLLSFLTRRSAIVLPTANELSPAADARHGSRIWLKHLTLLSDLGMTFPSIVAELSSGDSIAAGIAAILTGVRTYHALDACDFKTVERNAAVVDEVADVLRKGKFDAGGEWQVFDTSRVESVLRSLQVGSAALETDASRIAQVREDVLRMRQDGGSLRYSSLKDWDAPADERAYDLIFSNKVIEEFTDISGCFKRCANMLKPGGWMSHHIDLSSLRITSRWNGHLAYPPFLWRLVVGRRTRVPNCRLPSEYLEALTEAGFEIVWTARIQHEDGVPPERVSKARRHYPAADLKCAGLFVIARLSKNPTIDRR